MVEVANLSPLQRCSSSAFFCTSERLRAHLATVRQRPSTRSVYVLTIIKKSNTKIPTSESSTSTPPKPDVHSTITPQIDQSLDVNPLTGKPRVISKELQKGAFHMLKDINQNKGKVFIGERVGEGGSVMTWPEIEGEIERSGGT